MFCYNPGRKNRIYDGKGKQQVERLAFCLSKNKLLPGAFAIFLFLSLSPCFAFTDEQIVNAIFKAEGSYRAAYLYGIRSVPYKDEAEARHICFNTVRNNRKRFAKQSTYKEYLNFLASRYCPVGCDNDRGTNKYWLKNVRWFLSHPTEKGVDTNGR